MNSTVSDPQQAGYEAERALVEEAARRILREFPPDRTPLRTFLAQSFDEGLAWVHFPVGRGGLGVDAGLQDLADGILQGAGAPSVFDLNPMAYGMGGPTVAAHGSERLQEELLKPMYTCEHIWCQLFSEPGAGSDLAGLATRASRSGDEWVVNGQKVWTSKAHEARWAMLLARTDPDAVKHKGLTYFLLDMHSAGVKVRPLRQMTGGSEFNEVYLEDVRIPDSQRLGDVGDGWRVALTTLSNERNAIGGGSSARNSGVIEIPLRLWAERPELRTPALQERLVDLFARADASRLTGERQRVERGGAPIGPEGSAAKLVWAELGQDVLEFCMDFLGPEAMLYSDDYQRSESAASASSVEGTDQAAEEQDAFEVQRKFLRSRAYTIEGGTSDILRNIVGERVLGLPGDLRADKGKPWSEVPRG